MVSFDYDPVKSCIALCFECSECGSQQKTKNFRIPSPNYDDVDNSDTYNDYEHLCSCCQKIYTITLHSSIYGGIGEIRDLDDANLVGIYEEGYDERAYYRSLFDEIKDEIKDDRKYIDLFHERMASVEGLIVTVDKLSENDQNILFPMLYVNMIASVEAYLADTFIRSVLESEENKRKFVETFKDFENVKISFKGIYEKMDGIDMFIFRTLRDIIYHNLGKVKGMYRDALGIDLGDIKELMEAVNKRHDIVHRNCKDKEGNDVIIKKTDVEELFERVKNFVNAIDAQVHHEPTV